jgi:hypothetical protein
LSRAVKIVRGLRQLRPTSQLTLQFDLSRNIDGAAGDVQQAINVVEVTLFFVVALAKLSVPSWRLNS